MENAVGIRTPEALYLSGEGGQRWEGGSQAWYGGFIQRRAGCGPTNASQLVWYLARTRPRCAALCGVQPATRTGFRAVMDEMWRYVTPGRGGVNRTSMFVDGVTAFGEARGVPLGCAVLEMPPRGDASRPDWAAAADFLQRALAADLPLAFLNLDNAGVRHLDSWHWVTLTGVEAGRGLGVMLDQGRAWEIELVRWVERNRRGGGFVAVFPREDGGGAFEL